MEVRKEQRIGGIGQEFLVWFRTNRRDHLPWRHTTDPYAVLVAEKLVQQTAARDSVISAFRRMLALYPSVSALADADEAILEEIVSPLGFLYRSKELKAMARYLLKHHSGSVPANLKELKALPGVGDYMARAVLSFAYGEDVAVVDTNVARFLYRVFAIPGPMPSNPARKKLLLDMAQELVPVGRSKEFNLAVLDLCASVCKPAKPLCGICPVQPFCSHGRKAME